ncbi:MAG: hypothetical protein NTZ27_10510 [Ignavibacteriales bacterium]|nr:hypothetical protein [Ignavibacteriales bacterium]
MKSVKYIFIVAGVYGLIVLLPMYFSESRFNVDFPPAITHPEYFYGFIGLGIAWQILFFLIATNPLRYKLMMIPAIIEKFSFGIAVIILFSQQRTPIMILSTAIIDLLFGVLFIYAFFKTKKEQINTKLWLF